jgi:hypothetical protein
MEGGDMKRFLVVVVLSLLAAALLPTSALATHDFATSQANPQGSPFEDYIDNNGWVDGTFPTPCGNLPAKFKAKAYTSSFFPGTFDVDITFSTPCLGFNSVKYKGDVTCLNATGYPTSPGINNSANWSGVINNVKFQPGNVPGIPGVLFPGMGVVGRWVDNWDFPAFPATPDPDRAIVFTTPGPLPCNHPLLSIPFTTNQITNGDLVVHDGI